MPLGTARRVEVIEVQHDDVFSRQFLTLVHCTVVFQWEGRAEVGYGAADLTVVGLTISQRVTHQMLDERFAKTNSVRSRTSLS